MASDWDATSEISFLCPSLKVPFDVTLSRWMMVASSSQP